MVEIKFCKKCECETQHIEHPRPDTPHGNELRCSECNSFWGWQKKPKNNGKRPANKYLPADLGIDHCQMCMRPKKRLMTNEVLISHHVHEIGKGGPDIPENIWVVCSSCHHLIHHQRTYLNEHYASLWDRYEKFKSKLWAVSPADYDTLLAEIRELAGI